MIPKPVANSHPLIKEVKRKQLKIGILMTQIYYGILLGNNIKNVHNIREIQII